MSHPVTAGQEHALLKTLQVVDGWIPQVAQDHPGGENLP